MTTKGILTLAWLVLSAQSALAASGPLPKDRQLAAQIISLELQIDNPASPLKADVTKALLKQQDALVNRMQATDPKGYETLRAKMAERAPNIDVFLRWATPEEIADDAGVTDEDRAQELVDEAAFGDVKPELSITVHIGSQTMDAAGAGLAINEHKIASARPGYVTPKGCYHPTMLEKLHWSHKYNAPMPFSVFFVGGVALHEGPVDVMSHGCVHLNAEDAQDVYDTVSKIGRANTQICVVR